MKKTILALLMSLASAAAFALPSPKAIEHALEAHDYQSAQSMTQEVLREKPNSAKAHLYNAYILLHQGQQAAANEELNNVNRLDKGDPGQRVVGSALYGRTVAEMERPVTVQRQQRPVAAPVQSYAPAQQAKPSGVNWLGLLALVGLIGGVAYLIRRRTVNSPAVTFHVPAPARVYDEVPANRQAAYRGQEYVPPAQPVYQQQPVIYGQPAMQQPAQQGMGMMGTAAAVAGGVVAGNAISNAFSGHRRRDDDDYETRRRRESDSTPAPSYYSDPTPSYSTPSYESRSDSYSAGSSDSYDSGSSSSSDSSGGGDW